MNEVEALTKQASFATSPALVEPTLIRGDEWLAIIASRLEKRSARGLVKKIPRNCEKPSLLSAIISFETRCVCYITNRSSSRG